jgi:diketogulonate reductase-like aldo/keto reductase
VTSIEHVSGQSWGQAPRTTRREAFGGLSRAIVVALSHPTSPIPLDAGARIVPATGTAPPMTAAAPMPVVELADGARVPALGLGTWRMGERRRDAAREVEALRLGFDLGMTLVDTAEMYGDGGAEEVVAKAIAGRREDVFVVSKVYPHNATAKGVVAACERSLRRLRTDRLDLYLLHWRGAVPLADTVAGFERLRRDGKIARWGVSNFDVADMRDLLALPDGAHCAANQVLYHLGERAPEWELLPLCRRHRVAMMAYSPLGQGELAAHPALQRIARESGTSAASLALAWMLAHAGVIAIPKASDPVHVRAIRASADLRLTGDVLGALDAAFPPPRASAPIGIL